MADEKSELEEEYEDAEADLEGVDPEDDAIEDVEDGEIFDDDDDEEFEEDASLEEVAESEEDDDDEVEADLSAILQERIAADDDEDDDESNESQTNSSEKIDSDEPKNKQHYIAPVLNHKIILSSWSNQHARTCKTNRSKDLPGVHF